MRKVSTTALSNILKLSSNDLFAKFSDEGLIQRSEGRWTLTEKGKSSGGEYREGKNSGKYIVWPENFRPSQKPEEKASRTSKKLITATNLAAHFKISSTKINYILSELGLLKKGLKGWLLTEQGQKIGGIQDKNSKSGVPFARWPESLLQSQILIDTINELVGTEETKKPKPKISKEEVNFRQKFKAEHRATDGHFVRSKAEMLVDNWLYMAEIVHAYERRLPIEEEVYSDFYIPTGKVYIEYWGYENDSKYLARKKKKQDIYKKYGFNLIELEDKDVQNLDDILPRMLLEFGVTAY